MHLNFIFAFLLAAVSAIHLFVPVKKYITKPLLIPLIAAYYLSSVQSPLWILVAALAASWLGDVLLMGESNGWFTAGGISFMLSHFLFIGVYCRSISFDALNPALLIPAVLVYYGVSAVIIALLKPDTPKPMVIPMYVYLLANSTMNIFSLLQLYENRTAGALIAYIGAVLFFISDCSLFLVRYYKGGKKFKSFFVCMLTYITGEFLITRGVMML